MKRFYIPLILLGVSLTGAQASDLSEQLSKLNAVGPEGKGNVEAASAWNELAQAPAPAILTILEAMDGSSPLAMNWMRSAAEAILERELSSGGDLPAEDLETFLVQRSKG